MRRKLALKNKVSFRKKKKKRIEQPFGFVKIEEEMMRKRFGSLS